VNTVRVEAGAWVGFNTDASGAAMRILQEIDPKGLRATVLGAGGTARTLATVLRNLGARVTVVNRTAPRGRDVAEATGVAWGPWESRNRPGADILVNATPLGTGGERAVDDTGLPSRLVVDVAYAPAVTPLVTAARERGVVVVDGIDFLVAQADDQYRLMTGWHPSTSVMREAAVRFLGGRPA
jgi:shikimate 5-dehydrogenase